MPFSDISTDHSSAFFAAQGARANYHQTVKRGPMIQTKITEPDKVPNVADGDSGPRVNFVWQVDLQIDDVGEDPRVGDQIEYLEGRYSGQTWRVSDVPIDGLDPPVFTVEVTRQL